MQYLYLYPPFLSMYVCFLGVLCAKAVVNILANTCKSNGMRRHGDYNGLWKYSQICAKRPPIEPIK